MSFFDAFSRDLSYAVRNMRKNPAFALTAVATLALGIGANTAIFTVVHSVLLKPLDYPEPDRLVRISGGATVARIEAIQRAKSFSEVGAFGGQIENVTLSGAYEAEPLKGARVSTNFLGILGVAPRLGRTFRADEQELGPQVAMISSELWQRRFAGDPQIVGRTVTLAAAPYTIVGVLPAGFQFPFADLDIWRPWQPDSLSPVSRLNSPIQTAFGRLRPGISLQRATAELAVINRQYALEHPGKLDAKPNRTEQVVLLKEQMVQNIRPILWMLFGAVGFVLIIACANIASLLLARSSARSREFAIRAAVGAGRGRLAGQLLTESLLLAIVGGAAGMAFAQWAIAGMAQIPGLQLPRMAEIHLDGMVLGFSVLLSVITSLLFGLAPSLAASRPDLTSVMKAGGEGGTWRDPKRAALWFSPRGLLVTGQVALAIVLLIGATLLIESLARLRAVDPGFRAANLLTMQIALSDKRYDSSAKSSAFFDELVRRVEAIPGVRSAAATLTLPATGWAGTPVHLVGQPILKLNERPIAILQMVTPGYFRTLEIPIRRGRDIGAQDTENSPLVVVINEALARHFFPAYPKGDDPIGRYILPGANPQPLRIVGVVADVRQSGLADEAEMGIYRPRTQTPPFAAMFAVRTDGDPLRYVNTIRKQVMSLDRDQAVTAVRTMEGVMDDSEGQRRSVMFLLELFAGAGLALAAVGIYGVIAYTVAQRTKEVAIRRALGAQQGDILRLVVGQGLALTLMGAAVGICGALALTRVLKSLLFGVSATDPVTFGGTALVLIVVAVGASYIPGRRAMKIDPASALRG